jgi:hypothetical protein
LNATGNSHLQTTSRLPTQCWWTRRSLQHAGSQILESSGLSQICLLDVDGDQMRELLLIYRSHTELTQLGLRQGQSSWRIRRLPQNIEAFCVIRDIFGGLASEFSRACISNSSAGLLAVYDTGTAIIPNVRRCGREARNHTYVHPFLTAFCNEAHAVPTLCRWPSSSCFCYLRTFHCHRYPSDSAKRQTSRIVPCFVH